MSPVRWQWRSPPLPSCDTKQKSREICRDGRIEKAASRGRCKPRRSSSIETAHPLKKACRLIREAGAAGADVISFPEGFIPTHPGWFNYINGVGPRSRWSSKRLFQNAVEIPSLPPRTLCAAPAAITNIMAVVRVNEKRPGTGNNLVEHPALHFEDGRNPRQAPEAGADQPRRASGPYRRARRHPARLPDRFRRRQWPDLRRIRTRSRSSPSRPNTR